MAKVARRPSTAAKRRARERGRRGYVQRRESVWRLLWRDVVVLGAGIRSLAAAHQVVVLAIAVAAAVALALVPIVNMTVIVATTGANSLSNDYVSYAGIVGQILGGTYHWENYFRDTFYGASHSFAFSFLFRIAVAKLAAWNIYDELYIGLIAAGLKLILFYDLFARATKGIARWALLPVLAALVFSLSQIDDFTYGDAALPVEIGQLCVAIAIWGAVRFRGQWRGVAILVVAGSATTLSGDGGLVWPMSLLGLILLGYRRPLHYVVWFLGAMVSTLPYLDIMVLQRSPGTGGVRSLLPIQYMVGSVGLPLTNNLLTLTASPQAIRAGLIGVGLCAIGLAVLWVRRAECLTAAVPALMLLTYSCLNIWSIAAFRGSGVNGMAPWYPGHFVLFWLALVGLASTLWASPRTKQVQGVLPRRIVYRLAKPWALAFLVALTVLYARSNTSYAEKVDYLYSRAPVSASCLYHYKTAPHSCYPFVFQWGGNDWAQMAQLAQPLQQHHLSVFAPSEEWTMQGDMAIGAVHVPGGGDSNSLLWSTDRSTRLDSFTDFRHLNLLIPAGHSAEWRLQIPANVRDATFHSAVAVSSSDTTVSGTIRVAISARSGGHSRVVFARELSSGDRSWNDVAAEMRQFAGKGLWLDFAVSSSPAGYPVWVAFQYPRLDITLT